MKMIHLIIAATLVIMLAGCTSETLNPGGDQPAPVHNEGQGGAV